MYVGFACFPILIELINKNMFNSKSNSTVSSVENFLKCYIGPTCIWNKTHWKPCVETFVCFSLFSQRCHFIWCHPSLLPHPVPAGPRATHRRQCVLQIDQQYTAAHITATKQVNIEYLVQVNNHWYWYIDPHYSPKTEDHWQWSPDDLQI